jgi:hypothetical protein
MHCVLLAAVLAAAPVKLAAPGFTSLNLSREATTYYSDHFAQQLAVRGIRVTTAGEIGTLLGLEKQKALLGCGETSQSCMTELANALGVDGIITGNLGKFGDAYQINIKILGATDGRPLSVFTSRVNGETALLDGLAGAADRIAPEVARELGRPLAEGEPAASVGAAPAQVFAPRRWAWVPLAGGGVAAAAGLYFVVQATGHLNNLRNDQIGSADPDTYAQEGKTDRNLGAALLGVGAAAMATGAVLYLWPSGESLKVTAVVAPNAAALTLTGTLP